MFRTTINKSTFKEIIKLGKIYRVQWDVQPIMVPEYDSGGTQTGEHEDPNYVTCMQENYRYKPELDEIKNLINGYYNDKINGEIITGFTYNPEGEIVLHPYLSNENQLNYKNAFDLTKDATAIQYILPYKIKNSNGYEPLYYSFTTSLALRNFYLSMIQYIQGKLEEAWQLKDSVDWSKYEIVEEIPVKYGTVMENTSIYGPDYNGVTSNTESSSTTVNTIDSAITTTAVTTTTTTKRRRRSKVVTSDTSTGTTTTTSSTGITN